MNYTDVGGGFSFGDACDVLAYDPGARVVTSDFNAGDVVIFGMYTLVRSSAAASPTLRCCSLAAPLLLPAPPARAHTATRRRRGPDDNLLPCSTARA